MSLEKDEAKKPQKKYAVKKTCFAYNPVSGCCNALTELNCYCCPFYKHKDDPINNYKLLKYRSRQLKEAYNGAKR